MEPGRTLRVRPGDSAGVSNSQKDNDHFEKWVILQSGDRCHAAVDLWRYVATVPEWMRQHACEQVVRRL
jgi:hypothetical protein